MRKRKFDKKVIYTGNGECKLFTIEPNGHGAFNLIVEDNENVLYATSDLATKKDCEIAFALYLLIRNGHSADIMVKSGQTTEKTTIVRQKTTLFSLPEMNKEELEENSPMMQSFRKVVQEVLDSHRQLLADNLSGRTVTEQGHDTSFRYGSNYKEDGKDR